MTAKDHILNVAFELFLTKGYKVGINEIIEKSKTSKGAFYHHFKSKEQLFTEAIHQKFFGFIKKFEYLDSSNLDPKEKVLDLVKMVFTPFKNIVNQISSNVNFLSIFAEYPKIQVLKEKNRSTYKEIQALVKNILEEIPNKRNVDIDLLTLHIVLLIDGALVDTLILFDNMNEAEKFCLNAVNQLLELLE